MKKSTAHLLTAFIPSQSFRRGLRLRLMLSELSKRQDHRIEIRYAKNSQSELAALCQKHGTDKGGIDDTHPVKFVHTYADYYEIIFGDIRHRVGNVLECGIGTINPDVKSTMAGRDTYKPGASLRMWREYFPDAQLVGLDIDEGALFTADRIETYQCDQTDPESIRAFTAKANRKFDIIIDDGLHTAPAAISFFDTVSGNLADDGIYVIEDLSGGHTVAVAEHLERHHPDWHACFVTLYRPRIFQDGNSLIVITRR